MNYAEIIAKHVVTAAFPNVKAELHDTGSAPGQYDFTLLSQGQPIGAMEVTSDVVEHAANFRAVLERKDYRLAETAVKSGWLLSVRSRAVTKSWLTELESKCDGLLAQLEVEEHRQIVVPWVCVGRCLGGTVEVVGIGEDRVGNALWVCEEG